jgi:hypothetical protein
MGLSGKGKCGAEPALENPLCRNSLVVHSGLRIGSDHQKAFAGRNTLMADYRQSAALSLMIYSTFTLFPDTQ